MKSFKKFLIESESDPRADINIPYQTPRDIYKIMTSGQIEDPAELGKLSVSREEKKAAWYKKTKANEKAKKQEIRDRSFTPMEIEEIGKRLGISRQRVSQILSSLEDRFGELANDEKLKELYKSMGKH